VTGQRWWRRRSEPASPADGEEIRTGLERLLTAILDRADKLQLDGSLALEIGELVPQDELTAKSAEQLVAEAFRAEANRLLDFGCGAGAQRPFLESLGYRWCGVDYLAGVAPGVRDQVAGAGEVVFYDGRMLPFTDEAFDVVYAMLSLMHVQHIDQSFGEIGRVLAPGGKLIGQVSSLEQMQDYGTFNYTPYGLKVAAQSHGLRLTQVYPKHDVFSFLLRRLMITFGASDDTELNGMFNPDGFFHRAVAECGTRLKLSPRDINLVRLMFSTHFVFQADKPAASA
jgi:SAM-dependent methyltransferase